MGEGPDEKLYEIMSGFELLSATYVAASLGIPDLLIDGGRTEKEFARLLRQAGFVVRRIQRHSLGVDSIIEAETA